MYMYKLKTSSLSLSKLILYKNNRLSVNLFYIFINLVHEQIHLEYSCIMCIFNHNVGHQNNYIQTSTVYDE